MSPSPSPPGPCGARTFELHEHLEHLELVALLEADAVVPDRDDGLPLRGVHGDLDPAAG